MRSTSGKSDIESKSKPAINRDRLPILLGIGVFIFTYVIFLMTLSPGISWEHHSEDSGDLITAAWVLGIPHPTGYPLFCILGHIWSKLIAIGSVAWRMNAFTALWTSLAALLMTVSVWRSFDLLDNKILSGISRGSRAAVSVSSGLMLAFATDVWYQSVITEIYSLNLFFTSLVSRIVIELLVGAKENENRTNETISYDWPKKRFRLIQFLAISWGFALTNHMTSIFLLPGIIIVLIFGGIRPKWREILISACYIPLILLLYLYLPIRSFAHPPLDWGIPESLGAFVWEVSGAQFRSLMFNQLPYQMLYQVMHYYSIPNELGVLGAILSGFGVSRLILGKSRQELALLGYTFILVASGIFYLMNYYILDPEGYLLQLVWGISFWTAWTLPLALWLRGRAGKIIVALIPVLLIIASMLSMVTHYKSADLSNNYEAIRFGEESFANFERNAIAIEGPYDRGFTLWYYRYAEYADSRSDVIPIYIYISVYDWGLELMRRNYPDLSVPDKPLKESDDIITATIVWIIEHNIDRRPIYCFQPIDPLIEKGYKFEAVGLTYRVYPPSPPTPPTPLTPPSPPSPP